MISLDMRYHSGESVCGNIPGSVKLGFFRKNSGKQRKNSERLAVLLRTGLSRRQDFRRKRDLGR